jgi:chromosome segregation ATPase
MMTGDEDRLEAIRHRHWNTSVPYPQDRDHFETCAWMRQADTDLGQLLLLVDTQAGHIRAQAGQIRAAKAERDRWQEIAERLDDDLETVAANAQNLHAANAQLRERLKEKQVGVPPSEHQIRRLEAMAQRLEECQAELRRLKGEVTS